MLGNVFNSKLGKKRVKLIILRKKKQEFNLYIGVNSERNRLSILIFWGFWRNSESNARHKIWKNK